MPDTISIQRMIKRIETDQRDRYEEMDVELSFMRNNFLFFRRLPLMVFV